MVTTRPNRHNLNLEEEVSRLEAELRLYKELKLTRIERRINELLDALDNPATPQTKGQQLRERLGIIAATVALTAIAQAKVEIPIHFQQPVKQEQVSPKLTPSLENVESTTAPEISKPEPKPIAKPEVKSETSSLQKLMRAIATQESANNPKAINSDSGASGKWQIMPSNIPSWSQAALGRKVSHGEFMRSPQLQKQIVEHRLGLYLKQESTPGRSEEEVIRRVASLWYSGRAHLWNNTRPQFTNGRQYPSIASYTRSIWTLYQQQEVRQQQPKYSSTKAIIKTWPEQLQQDPKTGEIIAGYKVTSPRGMRTLGGVTRMHQGVDLGTPIGTPIYAIADGHLQCEWWADAGRAGLFTSDEFPGLRFDLLHLNSCAAQRGVRQRVKKGEIIGTTGTWGTGPHLHLAIKGDSNNFLRVRGGWLHWFIKGEKP